MREFDITVRSNARDVALLFSDISDSIIDQAKVSAINKSLTIMRTAVRKQVSAETGVPSKRVGKRVHVKKAKKKTPVGRLWFGTYAIKAIELGAKQLKSGVSHQGPGGRVKKPHAFITTMKSGHRGVYQRTTKSRLPIKEETVSVLASARRAVNAEATVLPKNFKRIFNSDFGYRVDKAIDRRRVRPTR